MLFFACQRNFQNYLDFLKLIKQWTSFFLFLSSCGIILPAVKKHLGIPLICSLQWFFYMAINTKLRMAHLVHDTDSKIARDSANFKTATHQRGPEIISTHLCLNLQSHSRKSCYYSSTPGSDPWSSLTFSKTENYLALLEMSLLCRWRVYSFWRVQDGTNHADACWLQKV